MQNQSPVTSHFLLSINIFIMRIYKYFEFVCWNNFSSVNLLSPLLYNTNFKQPERSQILQWTTSSCFFWTFLCVASFDGPVLAQTRAEVDEMLPYMASISLLNRSAAILQNRCSPSAKHFSVSAEKSIYLFLTHFFQLEEFSFLFPIQKHSFTQIWSPIN